MERILRVGKRNGSFRGDKDLTTYVGPYESEHDAGRKIGWEKHSPQQTKKQQKKKGGPTSTGRTMKGIKFQGRSGSCINSSSYQTSKLASKSERQFENYLEWKRTGTTRGPANAAALEGRSSLMLWGGDSDHLSGSGRSLENWEKRDEAYPPQNTHNPKVTTINPPPTTKRPSTERDRGKGRWTQKKKKKKKRSPPSQR